MKYGRMDIQYTDGVVIPSIVLGNGSVGITNTLKGRDGFVGVGFYPAPGGMSVGDTFDNEAREEPITVADLDFHLLFDNPASIDVVIGRLEAAKASLIDGLLEGLTDEILNFDPEGDQCQQ